MTTLEDSKIEQTLRQVVREAEAKDEDVTVKRVRAKAESLLKLDAGFFREEPWKTRSKAIVEDAFQNSDEQPAPNPPTPNRREVESPAAAKKQKLATGKSLQQSVKPTENTKVARSPISTAVPSVTNLKSQASPKRPGHPHTKVNGVKRKASEQSSSEESSSEIDAIGSSGKGAHAPEQKKRKTDTSSGSGESTESESDSEQATSTTNTSPPQTAVEGAVQFQIQAIPTTRYNPPPGFVAMDRSQLAQDSPFSASALEGKQIWHITAPSNVGISSLHDFALETVASNQAILSHDSVEYVFKEDTNPGNDYATILEPMRDGYKPTRRKVERKLNLQPKITLPNLSIRQASQVTGSSAAGNIAAPSVSQIRPQPKGLRMRYRPPGFGPGELGSVGPGSESMDDEGDTTQRRSSFQFPKALGAHGTTKRNVGEHNVDTVEAETATPAKKSKKKKKRKEQVIPDSQSQETKVNGVAASKTSASPPMGESRQEHSPDVVSKSSAKLAVNGVGSPLPSKEEKAKRKEEKRLKTERKEAKRKARETSR